MSSDLHISYRPLPDATPEAELDALAAAYSFLVQRHANRKAAENYSGDDEQIGGEQDQEAGVPGVAGPQFPVQEGSGVFQPKHEDLRKEVFTNNG